MSNNTDYLFKITASGTLKRCLIFSYALMLSQSALADPSTPFTAQHADQAKHGILSLRNAIELATSDNLGLAAMQARANALAEIPSQVGTLPDPTLSLNALNFPVDTFSRSQVPMTQTQIGIGFTLPYPGKLELREQVATKNAQAAQHNVAEKRIILIRDVRLTWWSVFYLDRALIVVQQNQVLLRQLNTIAETKYKTGQGTQSDVLLAQVELSKLLDMEITLNAARRNQAIKLNALLGRNAASQVALPSLVSENLPPAPDSVTLIKLSQENRPLLDARRNMLEAARIQTQLAKKDYYPDFKLGTTYGFRSGNNLDGSTRADLASLKFSMNLPIFTSRRQDKAVTQRQAEMQEKKYALQDASIQISAEIEQAISDYQSARKQASLFRTGIIPQASQTTAAMLTAYQVSKVDFLNLVRAQITLYNYQTQYWKALSTAWQAWARLEAAAGTPVLASKSATDKEHSHE